MHVKVPILVIDDALLEALNLWLRANSPLRFLRYWKLLKLGFPRLLDVVRFLIFKTTTGIVG